VLLGVARGRGPPDPAYLSGVSVGGDNTLPNPVRDTAPDHGGRGRCVARGGESGQAVGVWRFHAAFHRDSDTDRPSTWRATFSSPAALAVGFAFRTFAT
jgi:hypothetical protein